MTLTTQVEGFRLSPQQETVWQKTKQEQPRYVQSIWKLHGTISDAQLQTAVEQVAQRYEIFRTRFPELPGLKMPVQVIEESGAVTIKRIDASHIPAIDREKTVRDLLPEQVALLQPNPEGTVQPILTVIRFDANEQFLIVTLSALQGDLYTVTHFGRELASLLQGQPLVNEEEPLQYADIAEWQHELLQEADMQELRAFYEQHDLATQRQRGLGNLLVLEPTPYAVSRQLNAGGKEGSKRLAALAERCGVTVETLLLATWQLVLLRSMAQEESLVMGLFVDGRSASEEIATAMGPLSKCLPLSTVFDAQMPFAEYVAQVDAHVNRARDLLFSFRSEHFESSQGEQALERGWPFAFEYVVGAETEERLQLHDVHNTLDDVLLKLTALQLGDQIRLSASFDTQAIASEDVARLLERFWIVLDAAAEQPNGSLIDLPLLDEREAQKVLVEFQGQPQSYPKRLVHERIAEQAQQHPEATALRCEAQVVSYGELEARTNQMAAFLRERGVTVGTHVGVLLERSVNLLIALLGIWKAGGAYVPLDPKLPTERLHFMVADAGAKLVLTMSGLVNRMSAPDAEIVQLDTVAEEIAKQSEQPVESHVALNDLCYLLYTSGSTGTPKGVMIEHEGLAHYLNWAIQNYPLEAGTGTVVHSSIGFDLTVTSLFAPLLVGGFVELLPEGSHLDDLKRLLTSDAKYGVVKLTPAHLEALSQMITVHQIATKAFIVGGEALSADLVQKWRDLAPDVVLYNEYGPTETVVGCSVYQAPKLAIPHRIPIGRPIDNMRVYVLNESGQPLPIGVPGELYISGVQMARGYLNREELTNERFLPDPFAPTPGQRMYRTGDIGRFLADGTLEYWGRQDDQVKIRGYRIELGEIEAVLQKQEQVQQAVVVVRQQADGPQLVAYVTAADGGNRVANELRDSLQRHLPDYMIPAHIVEVPEIPLTNNGKVDRKALPEPSETQEVNRKPYVAPRTLTEEILTGVFEEVLRIEHIGVDDNFFTLGGHSLLSIQVITRLRESLQVHLSVVHMFDNPTVAQLAVVVEALLLDQMDKEM